MASIDRTIEVDVPLTTAYNQWTQFGDYPSFMEGVREVNQLDPGRLRWVVEAGGQEREWFARITLQVPDEVIAWESEEGPRNAGQVVFRALGDERTEVGLRLDVEVGQGSGESLQGRVDGDLQRFKRFIEERGMETGAWRGRIEDGLEVAPQGSLMDSHDRPEADQIRPSVTAMDAPRNTEQQLNYPGQDSAAGPVEDNDLLPNQPAERRPD